MQQRCGVDQAMPGGRLKCAKPASRPSSSVMPLPRRNFSTTACEVPMCGSRLGGPCLLKGSPRYQTFWAYRRRWSKQRVNQWMPSVDVQEEALAVDQHQPSVCGRQAKEAPVSQA